jgi:hypothetical protein
VSGGAGSNRRWGGQRWPGSSGAGPVMRRTPWGQEGGAGAGLAMGTTVAVRCGVGSRGGGELRNRFE